LRRFGVIAGADRALDFGCGLGRLSRALGERFADVLGMDISPAMAEQATRLNRRVAACRFVVNPCADLRGVPSDEFDLVIFSTSRSATRSARAFVSFCGSLRRAGSSSSSSRSGSRGGSGSGRGPLPLA
jgi:SAM-dependent methyltransferase